MEKRSIIEAIKQYETIIIHRHVRPDPDALRFSRWIKRNHPNFFTLIKMYILLEWTTPSYNFLLKWTPFLMRCMKGL